MNQNINILQSLFNIVFAFSAFVGGLAALAILYAGILLIFSGNNPQQERQGKLAIGFAILGAVVAIGAVTLAKLITGNIK